MADIHLIDENTLADLQILKKDIEEINQFYHEQSMLKIQKIPTEKKNFIDMNENKNNNSQPSIDLNESHESKKSKEDNKTIKRKIIYSTEMKMPKIKKENFNHFLKTELTPKQIKSMDFSFLNYNQLKDTILIAGTFPENARKYIWRYLLSLPNNIEKFKLIAGKGIHPLFEGLNQIYKVSDRKYLVRIQEICSLIAYWNNGLGNIHFLTNIVYPFIKVFSGDDIFVFETLVALFTSVIRYWFEFYPNLPYSHIKYCIGILNKEHEGLVDIFRSARISENEIIWRLLTNFFSESFKKDDWVSFVDFIITFNHKPEMILYFSIAFILSNKEDLSFCKNNPKKICEILYDIKIPRKMSNLFRNTIHLFEKYSPNQILKYESYIPFPENGYPVIENIPLDLLATTSEIKDELKAGELDIEKAIQSHDAKKKLLEKKYSELLQKEREIEYCYNDMIEAEKKKNEILKWELGILTYQRSNALKELDKIK